MNSPNTHSHLCQMPMHIRGQNCPSCSVIEGQIGQSARKRKKRKKKKEEEMWPPSPRTWWLNNGYLETMHLQHTGACWVMVVVRFLFVYFIFLSVLDLWERFYYGCYQFSFREIRTMVLIMKQKYSFLLSVVYRSFTFHSDQNSMFYWCESVWFLR